MGGLYGSVVHIARIDLWHHWLVLFEHADGHHTFNMWQHMKIRMHYGQPAHPATRDGIERVRRSWVRETGHGRRELDETRQDPASPEYRPRRPSRHGRHIDAELSSAKPAELKFSTSRTQAEAKLKNCSTFLGSEKRPNTASTALNQLLNLSWSETKRRAQLEEPTATDMDGQPREGSAAPPGDRRIHDGESGASAESES